MNLERLRAFLKQRPFIGYPLIALSALIAWSVLMLLAGTGTPSAKPVSVEKNSTIGLSVGGADQQAYLMRLEKNYYDFEDRVKAIEKRVSSINSTAKEMKKQQKEMAKVVLNFDEKLAGKAEDLSGQPQLLELTVADIKPLQKDEEDFVYLPIGSFCKGTLLTGVYAAADVNNPLPVLISLDEAFYGPNKTRIPLKGSFALGKAYGDVVSERALIQIVALSSVLPNGQAFEREENLGYVTDEFGELGIHGEMVRNTGRQLALSFMGGFMSGGAQALANDEETVTNNPYGGFTRQVNGSAGRDAIFSGLAKSAARMSDYYDKQAENLIPAVHVYSGTTVYFIVQKGVTINGLPRTDYAAASYVN